MAPRTAGPASEASLSLRASGSPSPTSTATHVVPSRKRRLTSSGSGQKPRRQPQVSRPGTSQESRRWSYMARAAGSSASVAVLTRTPSTRGATCAAPSSNTTSGQCLREGSASSMARAARRTKAEASSPSSRHATESVRCGPLSARERAARVPAPPASRCAWVTPSALMASATSGPSSSRASQDTVATLLPREARPRAASSASPSSTSATTGAGSYVTPKGVPGASATPSGASTLTRATAPSASVTLMSAVLAMSIPSIVVA